MRDNVFEVGASAIFFVSVAGLFVVAYAIPMLPPAAFDIVTNYLLEAVLPAFSAWALFRASRRWSSPEARAFFGRVGLAYLAWAVAVAIRWPLQRVIGEVAEDVARDFLYGLYYVAMLWAIEWAPRPSSRSRMEKLVALAGSLILVTGSLLYLRIIPAVTLPAVRHMQDALLYLVLDTYVAVRLAMLASGVEGPRRRVAIGLLAAAGFCIALSDGVGVAFEAGLLSLPADSPINLAWALFYLPLVLAAHVRDDGADSLRSAGTAKESLWSPLIAYGFALPAVHVLVYGLGLGSVATERARVNFVLCWLLVVALLIFLQRAAISRRILSTERALQVSLSQVLELTGARETAVEEERKRLARDLHDGLGQLLVAMKMEFSWLSSRADRKEPAEDERFGLARSLVRDSLEAVHRISAGRRPGILDERGLVEALRELIAVTAARSRVEVRLIAPDLSPRVTPDGETALYRVAQESLTNSAKHARASRIEVELSTRDGRAELEVRDDGVGVLGGEESSQTGLGFISIAERAQAVGGDLRFGAGLGGRGFSVTVAVPLANESAEI